MPPVDAVITPVQLPARGITGVDEFAVLVCADVPPGDSERERDFFGHAVHGESAVRDQLSPAPLNALALKSDLRELLDREEIRRAQMVVALGDAGVDARSFDDSADGRFGDVAFVVF